MPTTISVPGSAEDESLLTAVVNAVAEAEGVSPLELDPLATAVDTDTLEKLDAPGTGETVIEFRYAGYEVTVESTDRDAVMVAPALTSYLDLP